MKDMHDRRSEGAEEARPAAAETVPNEAKKSSSAVTGDQPAHRDQHAAPITNPPPGTPPKPSEAEPQSRRRRKWLLLAGAVVGLAVVGYFLVPWVITALTTVSAVITQGTRKYPTTAKPTTAPASSSHFRRRRDCGSASDGFGGVPGGGLVIGAACWSR